VHVKFFPLKIAIVCLLLPTGIYIAGLIQLEKTFTKDYSNRIQNVLVGDSEWLLKGSVRLEDQIARNIKSFMAKDWKIQVFKIKVNVQVTSTQGRIIYPKFLDENALDKELVMEFDSQIVARENFDLLNRGLEVAVDTSLRHGSRLANLILVICYGVSSGIFFIFYNKASRRFASDSEEKARLIHELKKGKQTYKKVVDELETERNDLFDNIRTLNAKYQEDQKKAKISEEELFEEIISLEEQMAAFIKMKENRENQISELKSQVQKFERRKNSKGKRNEFDFLQKRFTTLYKNIDMHRKAIDGFMGLNDDQQIKAEEVVHQLDTHPDSVIVKRKVFSGKKHRTASFEVLFAYNGRLYFRKGKNNRVQVLVIGTKKTQTKDMEFLQSL
jgi:DNA repair exonuclease SbcCD ATPase subunit